MNEWLSLLALVSGTFTRPGFALFQNLATAWILCPVRRTVTGMIRLLGPDDPHAHDAYHRLLRAARWSLFDLWGAVVKVIVNRYSPEGRIETIGDDTLARKTGRKVAGASRFRDPVLSTRNRPVFVFGLNAVVLAIRIRPPWGGEPLALPVNFRLYRKGGPSHLDLMEDMMRELARWLPEREFHLTCDGAYASLASRDLPRTHVTSRMRRDAALFDLPPARRPGQRGRPRKRGDRLPPLTQIARQAHHWRFSIVEVRGRFVDRLIYARPVLWYAVCGSRPVLLVISRDPKGHEPDDFFFTTDLDEPGYEVVGRYAGRWPIEDTFRNTKQFLGAQQPQCWKHLGPERALGLAFWLYTAVWHWYLSVHGSRPAWLPAPWYPSKTTPSFPDALAALRRVLWRDRIFVGCRPRPLPTKISDALIDVLARAA
jgi:hypothetical protein